MKKNYLLMLCLTITLVTYAQPIIGFTYIPGITGISSLVDIVHAKDGSNRLFLVQQNGIIKIWNGTSVNATPFLDISTLVSFSGERGLLSMAFHPNYATNGYFFVYYTNDGGNISVARFSVSANPDVALSSGTVLITIPHNIYSNHNGGKLHFGSDGYLYFGTGDGGSSNDPLQNSQNTNSLLGKMLRIDVDGFATSAPFYTIPPGNPFAGNDGIADEIYDLGLRNPWRWSFDRLTNDMWIADVGQNAWEEVNYRTAGTTAGLNYQWRCKEGINDNTASGVQPCSYSAGTQVPPVYEYYHNAAGGYSITGGYVYRHTEFPDLQGWYICADYVRPNAFLIKPDGMGGFISAVQSSGVPANITTFGEAQDGTLYAGAQTGFVFKVVLSGLLPVKLQSFTATYNNNKDLLQWTATVDPSLVRFEIEQSADGTRFTTIDNILPQMQGSTASYHFSTLSPAAAIRYYRLKLVYANGSVQYTATVTLSSRVIEKITVVHDGSNMLRLYTPYPLQQVRIINNAGQLVTSFSNLKTGWQVLATGYFPAGMYWVQCISNKVENVKVVVW